MSFRPIALALGLALLAVAPAVASAATIQVDRGCYADPAQRQDTVQLTGSGFTPNATYQVTLDGKPLTGGTGTVDGTGAISGTFVAPGLDTLPEGTNSHKYVLGVIEGTNAPTTTFTVTRLYADFTPAKGDPKTLKVRFKLYGFGLQGASRPAVYVHYIRPNGKVKKTYRLGTASGPCGTINQTSKRRLFPFSAERGSWRLQFDTSKSFHKGTAKSDFLFYTVGVDIKPRG